MSVINATLSVPSGRSFYSSLVLLAATMTMGISAGVFQLYAFTRRTGPGAHRRPRHFVVMKELPFL